MTPKKQPLFICEGYFNNLLPRILDRYFQHIKHFQLIGGLIDLMTMFFGNIMGMFWYSSWNNEQNHGGLAQARVSKWTLDRVRSL